MPAQDLATRHASDATTTVTMVANLRSLRARGDLSLAELDLATEAALLGLHTSFESFVRELYLQCVSGAAGIPGVRSNLRATSNEDAQAIIAGDRQFVDWLPISKTLDRALLHMRGGQPFVRIWGRNQVTRHLDLMQVVRNRIAHSGEEALRKYDKQIAKGQASFERPARWLLHASASKTNLDLIADATIAASADLASNDRTPKQLGPANATDGQRSAPGTYRCVSCNRVQHVPAWESLKPCPKCSSVEKCSTCGAVKQSPSTWRLEALRAVG